MFKVNEIINLGIGTDIENIERFKKLDRANDCLFLAKIFSMNELNYCFSKENAAPHLAARFAAKEAVTKALNSIYETVPSYNEIEILNKENGVPFVKIHDDGFHGINVHISLSHCKDKALAFAIVIGPSAHEND